MRALALVLMLAISGCDACVQSGDGDATTCLINGASIIVGESAPAGDGCNTCVCNSELQLVCTERDCGDAGVPEAPDGGPNVDEDAGPGEPDDAGQPAEPCPDADGDGFYRCLDPDHPERPQVVDCDDTRFHVQPGGIEFPDTPEDDNCDRSSDDWESCPCGVATAATDLAGAMDLCGDVMANVTKSGAAIQFGIVDAYQGVIDVRRRTREDEPGAAPVIIGNDCMATMSTGDAVGREPGVQASGCDGNICDLARIDLSLRAPPNASGFAFDFMFLSYEWPEFLCLTFNDTFLANVRTPAVNDGAETNAAFDTQGRPITVNVGFFENPADWTVPLDDTSQGAVEFGGFGCPFDDDPLYQAQCELPAYCSDANLDVRAGSGSGWLTTKVPIVPGQPDLRLTLRIHDEGDQEFDSIVLLDGFRWLPTVPELETAKED